LKDRKQDLLSLYHVSPVLQFTKYPVTNLEEIMAAKTEQPVWGLLSGAAVGTVFGVMFSPPFAGPVLGVLVGAKILRLANLKSGAWFGGLMGLLMGLGIAMHHLVTSGLKFDPAAWCNLCLASMLFYAAVSAAAGAAAGLVVRWVDGNKFFL
jgi:hypothetical protein